ncbi:MAG: 2-C-methyl-D-erythritol 4-phosphate cytidylyltransferase [Clostridiales Family XIII bacterium]|jgi:2-C-methyl-D-erythritol 4-phosphate cytidylyltransferase/2-C-methyl-D-erythritol 2,4-cyclodiphosphate synthase|nr:2-C-methyl-D-erythritol 4-phosphate cytidylyltransferase [Clostridiales Family XIII bacterium]
MHGNLRVAALIAAAGTGLRMGGDVPKQFMKIGEKTVLEMSVEAFEANAFVDDVFIVADKVRIAECERVFTRRGYFVGHGGKIRAIVPGGASRQESVMAGLEALGREVGIVLVHDAARPLVSDVCIDRVVLAAAERGAAVAAVPVTDTIKAVAEGRFVSTVRREGLYAAQTPQGFGLSIISEAYEAARRDGFVGTDDAALVERLGVEVFCVEGDHDNFKITVPGDLAKAEAILNQRERYGETLRASAIAPRKYGFQADGALRIGTGLDAHRLVVDRPLVLGGVNIPHDKGLLGHSDADVLVHALMDALLGAAALGDIGKLFPDTEPAYEGISSMALLSVVTEMLEKEGWRIVNADVVVIAETPRLAPYGDRIRENLASAMRTDVAAVSVKATTTEGMGFPGRGEGIAAQAVVLLRAK